MQYMAWELSQGTVLLTRAKTQGGAALVLDITGTLAEESIRDSSMAKHNDTTLRVSLALKDNFTGASAETWDFMGLLPDTQKPSKLVLDIIFNLDSSERHKLNLLTKSLWNIDECFP